MFDMQREASPFTVHLKSRQQYQCRMRVSVKKAAGTSKHQDAIEQHEAASTRHSMLDFGNNSSLG